MNDTGPLPARDISVWWVLAFVSFGWGTGGTAVRFLYDDGAEPLTLIAVRSALASVALVAFLLVRRPEVRADRRTWKVGLVLGVVYLAAFTFFVFMLGYASAGFAGLFAGLSPLTTALWSAYGFRDQKLKVATLFGLLAGGAGLLVLALSQDSGLEVGGRPTLALVLGIACITCIGFGVAYSNRHAVAVDAAQVTTIQMVTGAVLAAVLAYWLEGDSLSFSLQGWLALSYVAVVATALPFVLFLITMRQMTAIRASLVGYLIPVVAATAGVLLLDEKLQPGILGGGLLIMVGLFIANWSEGRIEYATRGI